MFTGLVEETGTVAEIESAGSGKRVTITADTVYGDADVGDSISVCGVCLTVEALEDDRAEFFVANETFERTWFSRVDVGTQVNLERCLTPTDRMGGHIVQGHVDATTEIRAIEELESEWQFTFEKPAELSEYVVEKGFIAIEGMSLTITHLDDETFSVMIIPETYNVSNLSEKAVGDRVNLEVDVVAKYVESVVA